MYGGAKSQLLGHLDLGQIVIFTDKQGKWCLVATSDVEGWVRSKYLKPLRK